MEIRLRNTVPFLGDTKKGMCERLEELRDFGNCGEVMLNLPEEALENYGGFRDG